MKYVKPLILLLFLFCILFATTVSFSKPMPSLSLKLKWQDENVMSQDGGLQLSPQTIILSVFSHVTTDDLEISITLPEGVVLLDGELKTINSIKKAEPIEQRFVVEFNENTIGDIKVEARIKYTGHTSFYAAGLLPIAVFATTEENASNKPSPRSLKPENKENYKRVMRNGEWLREYKLP